MGFHQQYLAKNPSGYCPDHSCEVSFDSAGIFVRVRALNAFDLPIKPLEQGFGACLHSAALGRRMNACGNSERNEQGSIQIAQLFAG